MTEAIPANGVDLNAAIAQLIGWRVSDAEYGIGVPPGRSINAWMPDFCRKSADCESLLAILKNEPYCFAIKITSETWQWVTQIDISSIANKVPNLHNLHHYGSSKLYAAEGWRDSLTRAAWYALTYIQKQKETNK